MIPLLLSGLALAAPHGELSAELGTTHYGDAGFERITGGDWMPQRGLRLGVSPMRRLTVIAGWTRASRGAEVFSSEGTRSFSTALTTDTASLGLKGDLEIGEVFFPYIAGRGLLVHGRARLDDDPDDRDSPVQLRRSGVTGGFQALGGAELRGPQRNTRATFGLFLEMGYGWAAPLALGDLGSVRARGFVVHSGAGIRM